ncbi:MAG: hypothetical protein AABX13_05605 [Nanoarchaeota archaeon]
MVHIDEFYIFKEEIVLNEGGRQEDLCAYTPLWPGMVQRFDSAKRYSPERGQLELLAEKVAQYSMLSESRSPEAEERAKHPETAFAEIRCNFKPSYDSLVNSLGDIGRTHTFSEKEQREFLGYLRKTYLAMRDPNKRSTIYIDHLRPAGEMEGQPTGPEGVIGDAQ